MAKQIFTLYICKDISQFGAGKVHLNDFDLSRPFGSKPSDYILLGKIDQEIDVPEIDVTQIQIDAMEKSVQLERAESQSRVNLLLDRISKLKAIGHSVGAGE